MNIFEDLIDELKEENLLEATVSESVKTENMKAHPKSQVGDEDKAAETELASKDSDDSVSPALAAEEVAVAAAAAAAVIATGTVNLADNQFFTASEPTANEAEFYRKRAVAEVSGLQMVEHIFSGVERQQKKAAPKVYDDLNVKKALHAFLQITGDASAPEHAAAEFQLMQETESWYSALSHRDKQISIAHLRRYCETTKPVLSSQALIALARFYRNSPYSEAVRSKFDLIVTRLFTREKTDEKREIVFERDDLMRHLSELYAEWESVSLYAGSEEGDEESAVLLLAFKFEDLMNEAEAAENFDQLVRNDFFNRLRSFKQSTNEQFFAPLVTATAIECNVRIGNRYIELLEQEKAKGDLEKLENKYGFLHDQVISDATSKTLQLVELLKHTPEPEPEEVEEEDSQAKKATGKNDPASDKTERNSAESETARAAAQPAGNLFAVNKWLLGSAAIVVFLSIAIYIWAEMKPAAVVKTADDVNIVRLENSSLSEFIRDARIGNNTFFAVAKPSWNGLNREKKEEMLQKILSIGNDRNFSRVHLLNTNGETVGTVADGVVEIAN